MPPHAHRAYRPSLPRPLTPFDGSDEEMGDEEDGIYNGSQSTVSGPSSPSLALPTLPFVTPILRNDFPVEARGTPGPTRTTLTIRRRNSAGFRDGYSRIGPSAMVGRTGLPPSRNTIETRGRRARQAREAQTLKTALEDGPRTVAESKNEVERHREALNRRKSRVQELSSSINHARRALVDLIGPTEEAKEYIQIEESVRLSQSHTRH